MRRLWVFQLWGGDSFRMQVKGNPVIAHDGRHSVLRCLCTEEEADGIEAAMEKHGCKVTKNCPHETSQQSQERKNLLQVLGGERPFPSPKCPECAWFDPHLDSLCGAGFAPGQGWDDAAIQGSMTSTKYQEDFNACPLREEQIQ